MHLRHKNRGSLFIECRRCIFGGKKAPAGAHLDTPSLDNTDSVYGTHRNTYSVYVIHRNLCLRHRQCVYLRHRNVVCTTYKLCICNIELVSLKHIICIFDIYFVSLRHIICIFVAYVCICNANFSVCNTYNGQKSRFAVSDNRCLRFREVQKWWFWV